MFITTANSLDRIPRPLQDRMEIIRIAGYTELEKLSIAKRYLMEKQKEANGLTPENIVFTDNALLGVMRHYTKEAGVRNLEREIAAVCRKVAVEVVKKDRNSHIQVGTKSLHKFFGPTKFRYGKADAEQSRSYYRPGLDRNGRRAFGYRSDCHAGKRTTDYYR